MDELIKQYSGLGLGGVSLAVLVWFLRQLLTVTIPALQQSWKAEIANERAIFTQAIKDERDACNKQHEDVMSALGRLSDKVK